MSFYSYKKAAEPKTQARKASRAWVFECRKLWRSARPGNLLATLPFYFSKPPWK